MQFSKLTFHCITNQLKCLDTNYSHSLSQTTSLFTHIHISNPKNVSCEISGILDMQINEIQINMKYSGTTIPLQKYIDP